MTQLSSIIREVDNQTLPKKDWEKRIILDNNFEILEKEPSWFSRKSAKYYIVSNVKSGLFADHSTSSFEIKVFGEDRHINVKIVSKVGCIVGKEEDLVKSLVSRKAHSFELALNDYIRDWIYSFIGTNAKKFIAGLFRNKYGDSLLEDIKVKAQDIGIVFQHIRYYLEGEEYLKTVTVKNENLETRFKDSIENHKFSINATLLIDEDNKVNAIATHQQTSDLEKLVNNELREYFPKRVEFEHFASNRLTVENEFKIYLNSILGFHGRKVGAIQIISKSISDVPKVIEKEFTVSINAPEYPEPIGINNKILVRRVDIAKFNANKPDNFEDWLKKQVENTIRSSFFEFKYSEIKENFETLKIKIKNELKSVVYEIGYELEQIIVIPSFEGLRELEKIDTKIEEKFITIDQEEVKLKVNLVFAIKNLKKISRYIDNNNISLLKTELKELCINEIKQYIHSVDVKIFHGNFEESDEIETEGSVKNDLTNLIKDKTYEKFGATINYIFFDRGEEEVIRKMTLLKKAGWTNFKSEIHSVVDYGITIFYGEFLVEGGDLELWQIFRNQDITIDNLKEAVQNSLSSQLKTKSSKQDLGYKTDIQLEDIHKLVIDTATKTIKANYGINIKLSNISRSEQDWETLMGSNRRKQILATITTLHEGLLEATAAGLYEEAKDIKKRLNNLEREIKKLDGINNRAQIGTSQNKRLTGNSTHESE